jgi:hypothetical protein
LRPRDAVIPASEQLYRTVEADWIDGDRVLILAIDGEGTSCARSAHATPDETLTSAQARRPAENGLVAITPGQLPIDFVASNAVAYDVFAFDAPLEGNESHCEVRWRRVADRPSTDHLKKVRGAAKDELKAAIASEMKVLVPPKQR